MDSDPLPNANEESCVTNCNPQPTPLLEQTHPKPNIPGGSPPISPELIRRFLTVTGGTVLYALSALSLVYGMWQLLGPVLAQSEGFAQILPCILAMNGYELALLGVLVMLVVWRHITEDAVSLLVMIALFVVVSGLVLTTATPSGPAKCLWIGAACTILGIGKLLVLRRWIGLRMGLLTLAGLGVMLAWNFLWPSLMARPFVTGDWPDALRRGQWMISWLILLGGSALVLIDAMRPSAAGVEESAGRSAFMRTAAMMRIFSLVLLAAACYHQYALRFMFLVEGDLGDYLPWLAVFVLLVLELMRTLPKRLAGLEAAAACIPLAAVLAAIHEKAITVSSAQAIEWLFYPPVLLAATGAAVLWMALAQRRQWFGYVAVVYALGVLLTVGFSPVRPHDLNWQLGGAGLITVLTVLGIFKRSPNLLFAAVVFTACGLSTTKAFVNLAHVNALTVPGAIAAIVGLGTLTLALVFGKKATKVMVIFGALCLAVSIMDLIPPKSSLVALDGAVAAGVLVLGAGLWLRIREPVTVLALLTPILPRAILFARSFSSWGFVVLSFVLLFAGAGISFFGRKKPSTQYADEIRPEMKV